MSQHITEWLAAYYDGELYGGRLQKVEQHLHTCKACQLELEQLKGLSALLKESPLMMTRTSADQFTAQVGLRLSRSTPEPFAPAWQKAAKMGWLAIPLVIIVVWAFSQTILSTIGVIQSLDLERFSSDLPIWTPWLFPFSLWGNPYGLWILFETSLWSLVKEAAPWLDSVEVLAQVFVPYLVMTVIPAVFLWCWLVCSWAIHQRHRVQNNL